MPKKGTSISRRDGPSQHARDHDEVAGVQAQPSVFFDSSGEALDGGNGVAEAKLGFGLSATSRDREREGEEERGERGRAERISSGGASLSRFDSAARRGSSVEGGPSTALSPQSKTTTAVSFAGSPLAFIFLFYSGPFLF